MCRVKVFFFSLLKLKTISLSERFSLILARTMRSKLRLSTVSLAWNSASGFFCFAILYSLLIPLRLEWSKYAFSFHTLSVYGEVCCNKRYMLKHDEFYVV